MPSFNNIDNGESGLSVRNTLNDVINYVNTGITSGSSFTYITEDTTPGSEFVNILSPRDVYISGGTSVELEYYGSPTITGYVLLDNTQTKLHFDDGSFTSQLELNSGGYVNLGMSQGSDYSNIDFQTTDITLGVSDGTYSSTETKQPQSNVTTISDGGVVRNTKVTQTFDSIFLQQGNMDYDGDITSYISLDTKDSGVSTGIGMGTTNGSITTSFNQGTAATDMNWTDGTINSVITLNVNGVEIASVDGGMSVTEIVSPTAYQTTVVNGGGDQSQLNIDSNEFIISNEDGMGNNSTLNMNKYQFGVTATDGIHTSSFELDPTNGLNGNRFYFTDGSNYNDLTLSYDYMIWDNNYVSGDTRVGLEFDPTGTYGETRFWKENYVTNEISKLGINTTDISLSSSDVSDTTSVGLDLTSILLSVDTPSNNRLQEISLDTDIVISSTSGGTITSNITIMEDIVTIISTDGVEQGELRVEPKGITLKFIPAFDDDADAAAGGLTADMLYQTTGLGANPLDVAGILMIKQ